VRRRVHSRLAVSAGALVVALALPVGARGIHETCAGAASGPSAAVVVDFGDVSDQGAPPAGVVRACVPLDGRVTGAQALVDAGFRLSLGPGGYVCAIDGYPASGCGEKTGDRKYLYWSYWKSQGEGDWNYSGIGAAIPLNDGATEGWRFVEGAGSPNDPRPRSSPDHDAICGRSTPEPTASSQAAPAEDPAAAPSDAAPSATPTATSTTPTDTVVDGSTTTSSVDENTTEPTEAAADELALASATPSPPQSGSADKLGTVLVVAVIVVLAAAAFLRSRRSGTE
jgi:hypothetical protein